MHAIDLTGKRFNRWLVLSRVENSPGGQARWLCRCDCGTERALKGNLVRHGRSRSCGCLKIEETVARSTKHGHAHAGRISPTYHTWSGMVARCTNPTHHSYARYGGRGIRVCDRWLIFANFLSDMGEKPEGLSLDRWPDQSGDYEPGNCRWATSKEQARNKRNNLILSYNGDSMSLPDWAEHLGIKASVIRDRLSSGWSVDRALTIAAGTVDDNSRSRHLTLNGETRNLSEWARRIGIPVPTLCQRLKRGLSIEKALTR